jgi:hypothetical protein
LEEWVPPLHQHQLQQLTQWQLYYVALPSAVATQDISCPNYSEEACEQLSLKIKISQEE